MIAIRTLLVTAVSLALAALSSWHAALLYSRGQDPTSAPMLFAQDPELHVRAADIILAAHPERLSTMTASLRQSATAALARAPLNVIAVRQLGTLADVGQQGEGGLAQYRVAEGITRRDLETEIALINAYARRGDIPGALARYDRALRVSPSSSALLLPVLSRGLSEPKIRAALAAYANTPWFHEFFDGAIERGADPHSLSDLLRAAQPPLSVGDSDTLAAGLLGKLVAKGLYLEVNAILPTLPGSLGRAVRGIDFSSATTDPRLGSLAWSFANRDGVETSLLQPAGLEIAMGGERDETLAERTTLLPAGRYVIDQTIRKDAAAGAIRLTWELSCLGSAGAQPLWQFSPPLLAGESTVTKQFIIPASCLAQSWRLSGQTATTQFDARLRLVKLVVTSVPNGRFP